MGQEYKRIRLKYLTYNPFSYYLQTAIVCRKFLPLFWRTMYRRKALNARLKAYRDAILEVVSSGGTVHDVAEAIRVTSQTAKRYCDMLNVKPKRKKYTETGQRRTRGFTLDQMLEAAKRGLSAPEFARAVGVTRQAVYWRLKRIGIANVFRNERRKRWKKYQTEIVSNTKNCTES